MLSESRQVACITLRADMPKRFGEGSEEVEDVFVTTDHSFIAEDLFLIAVVKDSFVYRLINTSNVFCVNFVSVGLESAVESWQKKSDGVVDKFSFVGVDKVDCDYIDCPRIKDAASYAECRVEKKFEVGASVIVVGKIMFSKNVSDSRRLFKIDNKITKVI